MLVKAFLRAPRSALTSRLAEACGSRTHPSRREAATPTDLKSARVTGPRALPGGLWTGTVGPEIAPFGGRLLVGIGPSAARPLPRVLAGLDRRRCLQSLRRGVLPEALGVPRIGNLGLGRVSFPIALPVHARVPPKRELQEPFPSWMRGIDSRHRNRSAAPHPRVQGGSHETPRRNPLRAPSDECRGRRTATLPRAVQ